MEHTKLSQDPELTQGDEETGKRRLEAGTCYLMKVLHQDVQEPRGD